MRAFTEFEQGALLQNLDRLRDRLLFLAGLYTGFRASELLALRVADVWKDGAPALTVTVARRRLKGGAGVHATRVRSRTVVLHAALRAAVAAYVAERFHGAPMVGDEILFKSRKGENGAITIGQAWRIIKGTAAGVGAHERIATHSMRKTFVRSVYDGSGHDILLTKEAVGHSSIMTTARYLETSEPAVTAAVLSIKGPGLPGLGLPGSGFDAVPARKIA